MAGHNRSALFQAVPGRICPSCVCRQLRFVRSCPPVLHIIEVIVDLLNERTWVRCAASEGRAFRGCRAKLRAPAASGANGIRSGGRRGVGLLRRLLLARLPCPPRVAAEQAAAPLAEPAVAPPVEPRRLRLLLGSGRSWRRRRRSLVMHGIAARPLSPDGRGIQQRQGEDSSTRCLQTHLEGSLSGVERIAHIYASNRAKSRPFICFLKRVDQALFAHEDISLAGAVGGADQPVFFHLLDERGRPVIAHAEAALQIAGCRPALAQHDIHSLIVKFVAGLADKLVLLGAARRVAHRRCPRRARNRDNPARPARVR